MNPFAALNHLPRLLQHPQVRDLAWVIVAPPLLDNPSLPQRHPLTASDWAVHPQDLLAWLQVLDVEPAPLLAWLAIRPVRRLGLYYERLWQFALTEAPGIEVLAANLPVRVDGRTLGEFDMILRDAEGCHHLELAVKLYLGRADSDADTTQTAHWLGPGSHDRLDIKLTQMCGPQLGLSATPTARDLFAERGFTTPKPGLWLGGYLFRPWPKGCRAPSLAKAEPLNGQWVYLRDWPAFRAANAGACWQPLERLAWLAPACLHERPENTEWACATLAPQMHRPTLLARLEPDASGRWQEVERVFVVPNHWPQLNA